MEMDMGPTESLWYQLPLLDQPPRFLAIASGSKSVPVEPLSDVITERDSTKTVTNAEERVIDTSSPRLQRKDDNVTV